MSRGVVKKSGSVDSSISSLIRLLGRVTIWITIGLLLIRGLGAVLASPQSGARAPKTEEAIVDPASSSLAVRFARTYFEDPSPRVIAPFLAEGVSIGRPWSDRGTHLTGAEVSGIEKFGGGGAVLTVACQLRDARVLYLAVPISRSRAGEVAVGGAPWVVAVPSTAGAASEQPRPLAGSEAAAISSLVEKFVPAYVSARSSRDLSYLLAPGAEVTPLAGAFELRGVPGAALQLGEGEGPRRSVVVACWLRDPLGGATYRFAYRLVVVKRNRWYVEAVRGELA